MQIKKEEEEEKKPNGERFYLGPAHVELRQISQGDTKANVFSTHG